jgi:hypothetical protein
MSRPLGLLLALLGAALLVTFAVASVQAQPAQRPSGGSDAAPAEADAASDAEGAVESAVEDPQAVQLRRAKELKARGDELSRSQKYADAIAVYRDAYDLGRDPAVLYNQGRAEDQLGDSAAALESFTRFQAEAGPDLLAKVPGLKRLIERLEGEVARLTVLANVPGARVTFEDRVLGEVPITRRVMNAGVGTLEVTREGHYPARLEVELRAGEAVTLQLELRSRETSGLLLITSELDEVTAFVDEREVGRLPAEVALPPGEHHIRVSKEGYRDETTTVVVRAGAEKGVNLDPRPVKKKLVQRWWFWTAVGGVVAGGVVATVAATTEKDGTNGDFSPGELTVPLTPGAIRF